MSELCFGQRIDPENGLVECWFTHGSLDWIKHQDWSDKNVLMFGAGMGDKWLAARCKTLVIIERKEDWYSKCASNAAANTQYIFRPCNDGSGQADYYTEIPDWFKPDVIINDDAYRTEVCEVAVNYFKSNQNGILVCDNYDQDYVWISPKAINILEPFNKHIHPQLDHTDHEGKCWKTAIIFIP